MALNKWYLWHVLKVPASMHIYIIWGCGNQPTFMIFIVSCSHVVAISCQLPGSKLKLSCRESCKLLVHSAATGLAMLLQFHCSTSHAVLQHLAAATPSLATPATYVPSHTQQHPLLVLPCSCCVGHMHTLPQLAANNPSSSHSMAATYLSIGLLASHLILATSCHLRHWLCLLEASRNLRGYPCLTSCLPCITRAMGIARISITNFIWFHA